MNEGVIKEIKFEEGKTYVKISLDLKYEEKRNGEIKNIYICDNQSCSIHREKTFAVLLEPERFFEIDENIDPVCLLNKKCRFVLDSRCFKDAKKIKSLTIIADNEK